MRREIEMMAAVKMVQSGSHRWHVELLTRHPDRDLTPREDNMSVGAREASIGSSTVSDGSDVGNVPVHSAVVP